MATSDSVSVVGHDAAGIARLNASLERLHGRKDAWARLPARERAPFLRAAIDGVLDVADEWVRVACQAKRVDPRSALGGEEWISGPLTTVRVLRMFAEALEAGGRPRPPNVRRRADGQIVASVLPATFLERAIFSGMSAEVWIQPGAAASQGRLYREKESGASASGKVALVLGAGNIAAIAPLDVISKLVVDDSVCILKVNPVNSYLLPMLRTALRALVEAGFVDIVEGSPEVGAYLARHPLVDAIHLTGSDRTHDAIVWGPPAEQAARKAAHSPLLDKPVTSELGCVTPVIVVPGEWSASDIAFQARHVASMVAHNASFNCTAAKVLVVSAEWPQRRAFLDAVRAALSRTEPRVAYYPGADQRYAQFVSRYPNAEVVGSSGEGVVPWTIAWDVPAAAGEHALTSEAFCGVLSVVTLDASGVDAFLRTAVTFVNDDVWGNLSCVLLVDGHTERAHGAALDQAIAGLRYGGIAVNAWSGANFSLGCTSWGAYPGNPLDRIESGRGIVHNTFLFDYPQKSVVRAPFRIRPTPIWFSDHRTLGRLAPLLTSLEAHPSWWKLPAIAWHALRG